MISPLEVRRYARREGIDWFTAWTRLKVKCTYWQRHEAMKQRLSETTEQRREAARPTEPARRE